MKYLWKIKNFIEALYQRYNGGSGLLAHKEDKRDKIFGGFFDKKPKFPSLSLAPKKWVFDQKYFNVCVFASQILSDSYQEGMRFSVKFAVKCAKREGMISGNGFSYLRAGLKIVKKYGRLPYELMPDEINESWAEYSKWDVTTAMLEEAKKWKAPSYKRINNAGDAIQALESGLTLKTANRWHSGMNNPKEPNFLIKVIGRYIGGHAFPSMSYKADNQILKWWGVLQSFGRNYGDEGYANIVQLFQKNNFAVYVVEKIKDRTDIQRFHGVYEGLCVKGSDSAIYLIDNGHKKPIKNWEAFEKMAQYKEKPKFYSVDDEILNQIPNGKLII